MDPDVLVGSGSLKKNMVGSGSGLQNLVGSVSGLNIKVQNPYNQIRIRFFLGGRIRFFISEVGSGFFRRSITFSILASGTEMLLLQLLPTNKS